MLSKFGYKRKIKQKRDEKIMTMNDILIGFIVLVVVFGNVYYFVNNTINRIANLKPSKYSELHKTDKHMLNVNKKNNNY